MTEKEFGKLTRQQLREYYAFYHGVGLGRKELAQLYKDHSDKFKEVLSLVGSWVDLYCLPDAIVALLFMEMVGLGPGIKDACQKNDPQQSLLKFLELDMEFPELTEEEEALALVCFMAMMGNFESSVSYGVSISALVELVSKGDDEALFKAVRTDRVSIAVEPITERIALAQITEDHSFMDRLAKAITQTKPPRPKADLDDTRFLLGLLEDSIGLDNLANKDIDELIADDLQAISGSNTFDRLSKLLTQFRNMSRK